MKGPPLGPGGEDKTWPDQMVPQGRKASSTRKIKLQTSNPVYCKFGVPLWSLDDTEPYNLQGPHVH